MLNLGGSLHFDLADTAIGIEGRGCWLLGTDTQRWEVDEERLGNEDYLGKG